MLISIKIQNILKCLLIVFLLAKFVTINMRDKNIIDLATGNAPIPMLFNL